MSGQTLIVLLLLAPLIGFLINGFRWKSSSMDIAGAVGTGAVALSFLLSLVVVAPIFASAEPVEVRVRLWEWFNVSGLSVPVAFTVDRISALMLLVVTGVGTLIHLFSIGYMAHDRRPAKYFAYLNLFIFNMLILILGDNLLMMFVGWEGVGLCSYLLIGFWFSDEAKAAAGMKAFITNRIGDAGFILGIFLIATQLGTVVFSEIVQRAADVPPEVTGGIFTLATLCLFIGATGKSAQIPLYVWLPDAMAGPTPVSALIHAATMVTAGVYMIVRLSHLFMVAPTTLAVVATIGAATALFAALIGFAQNDIKKVLAYSTVSQLGYMFLACGVGAFGAGLFHVVTHAFFKALMFLGSGSVIHAMHEEQDMRRMGGLHRHLPWTHATFVIGWLSILGMPPFSGFFSKDEILWMSFSSPLGSPLLWWVGWVTAMGTAFYMTRLMALTFWGKERFDAHHVHPHEGPMTMRIPLVVLAAASLVAGFLAIPHVIGEVIPGHPRNWLLDVWLEPVIALPITNHATGSVAMEWALMGLSVAGAGLSAVAAYALYILEPGTREALLNRISGLRQAAANKFYIDEIYECIAIQPVLVAGRNLWVFVDVNVVDRLVNGAAEWSRDLGAFARGLQNGNTQRYALYITIGLVASVFVLMR